MIDHRGTNSDVRAGYRSHRTVDPESDIMYDIDGRPIDDDSESEIEGLTTQKPSLDLDTRTSVRNFQPINPKTQEHLTPQHYFLFPRAIVGFALTQKQRSTQAYCLIRMSY